MGVRPNSPPHITSVSSSNPLCLRSNIKAVTALSDCRHLFTKPTSIDSFSDVPCVSQPQSKSCTNRTPLSINFLANKILFAIIDWFGSLPYILWIYSGSSAMFITSGTVACILKANSYCEILVRISGSLNSS